MKLYLFNILGSLMTIISLYFLQMTKIQIATNQDTRRNIKKSIESKDYTIDDVVTELLVDLQDEIESELFEGYTNQLGELAKTRFSEILPYILQKDFKWKIVRDLKAVLKRDIARFVPDKPIEQLKREKKTKLTMHLPITDVNNICSSTKKLKHHNKVLSYSVFGNRQIYYDGIEVVIKQARNLSLYKDWQIRIYHDEAMPPEKIKEYENYKNVLLCDVRELPRYGNVSNILGTFWRVAPMSDPSVDLFCPRDLDSAILTREEDAVNEFISSSMILHTMRDHCQHDVGMMAGMWCFHNRINRTMGRFYWERLLNKAQTYKQKVDQPLLNAIIWDHLSERHLYDMILQHDSYTCKYYAGSKPFPTKRKKDNEFIGCPVHDCDQKLKPCPELCRPIYGKTWKYC